MKIKAPYGRYASAKWGPMMPNRLGWVIMELPALVVFAYFFFLGESTSVVGWFFFTCWIGHYFYRSLIFPFKIRGKLMPVLVAISGFFFNCINGYFNGSYLGTTFYDLSWFYDPRFMVGVVLFFLGLIINRKADRTLVLLKEKAHQYLIPHGGLYHLISCPNYFGEIVQWLGFAIMTWSLPGLSFALWTIANLVPRAIRHHQWYRKKFTSYPKNRKAIIPYII
jgi:protein-S-isoprenylcysteine O-methyltransferase Ste14